ncbi:MAG TPA: Tox-REase-5 domain-containing protein [Aliidongia sp.]|uniref:Tox-REase-5 domain-containing protein n=1 Tax=Aliidongia sp. TaxID=1914230 RepID=UPI002DDDB380|nr:Tox-REase-5 domain-containing protein [Aliidongia sp.]HEV2676843.1 Tox-REase-5 domain-containing protein [Aliidongia sp.]
MTDLLKNIHRLHSRSHAHAGLVVDEDGVAFGPGCTLVRRLPDGTYRALDDDELAFIPHMAKAGIDARRLSRIAEALEGGNMMRAQLLGLQLPLAAQAPPDASLSKSGFDEKEPRKPDGEWTIGSVLSTMAEGMGLAETAAEGSVAAAARAALAGVARAATGVAGVAAGLVYPTAEWNTFQGTLPDRPDVDYRYDEGELALYKTLPNGSRTQLYRGRADRDQLYRNAAGDIVGIDLGRGFQVDIDRIEAPAGSVAQVKARSISTTDDPQVCPDPGPDVPHSASPRALAYQWQITNLPPMLAVALNGQIYDGCNEFTGHMLEAKGPGYERLMRYKFIWDRIQKTFDNLARRQSDAAGGRRVEWHFAEEKVADEVRKHFSEIGLDNIDVVYTPAIIVITPIRD